MKSQVAEVKPMARLQNTLFKESEVVLPQKKNVINRPSMWSKYDFESN